MSAPLAENTRVTYSGDLTTTTCGECGGTYALAKRYVEKKRESGGYWTCPYCKCSWGYGRSENDRLKLEAENARNAAAAERARHDQTRAALEHERNSARTARGHVTRIKNRIAAGVCPCCGRTFKDLARHMGTKHPDYSKAGQP